MTASSTQNPPAGAHAEHGAVARRSSAEDAPSGPPSATDIARAIIGSDTIALQISASVHGSRKAQNLPIGALALATHPAPPQTSEQSLQIAVAAMSSEARRESSEISTATPDSSKNGKALVFAMIILIAGLAAAGGILVGKSQTTAAPRAPAPATSTNR